MLSLLGAPSAVRVGENCMLQYSQMPSNGWSRTIRSFRFAIPQVYAARSDVQALWKSNCTTTPKSDARGRECDLQVPLTWRIPDIFWARLRSLSYAPVG